MEILLINPPVRLREPAYFQPVGLAIIANVLRNAGHSVTFADFNIHRDKAAFPMKDYDLIGISGIITTYGYVYSLVPQLRKAFSAPIVLGGGGFTSAPDVYMDNIAPDYGVIGEGEVTILELIDAIEGRMELSEVRGLAYPGGRTPPRPLEKDLDKFPSQAFDLLDMDSYADHVRHDDVKRDIAILATRGCPYGCSYCYHIFGRSLRYRSPAKVVDEMEHLIENYGIESFLFGDECFAANRKFVVAFCDEVKRRGLVTRWMVYSRLDSVDEELVIKMKEAGCFLIGFGIESGSQRILDEMGKAVTLETMKKNWRMTKKHLQVGGTLIFGMPGEDDESIEETLSFLDEIDHFKAFFHLAPYPGTAVFENNKDKILEKYGTLHNFFVALGDAAEFVVNLTSWDDDMYALKYMYTNLKAHLASVRRKIAKQEIVKGS